MGNIGWALVVVAASITGGCDDRSGDRASAVVPRPSEGPAAPDEPEAAQTETAIDDAPSAPERAESRSIAEAHRLLRGARHQLRRGRTEPAIAALRASVDAHPLPTAQCELGWALFGQGDASQARPLLETAVRRLSSQARMGARERNTLGACLYNLGRVEEDAQAIEAAVEAYRRSLSYRDNRVVRSRLDALRGDVPPAPEPDCAPVACDGPTPTLDASMERARASVVPSEPTDSDGGSEVRVEAPPREVSAEPSIHAATFVVEVGPYGMTQHNFVGVQTDAGWYACRVGGGEGQGDVFDGLREIRSTQVIPGGPPEMHVSMTYAYAGNEEGINNTMGTEETAFFGVEGGRPVVYGVVQTGDFYSDGMWTSCDGECEAEGNPARECCDEIEDISSSSSYQVVDGPAGVVRLRLTPDSAAERDTARSFDVPLRSMRCAETPTGRSRL